MDGIVVKLLADTTGRPSYWLGRIFAFVLPDLDRLRCYPTAQPWMGTPDHFDEDEPLWRVGGLGRYWRNLAEEYIQMWGFPATPTSIDLHSATALLYYWDSTCWEMYTSQPGVPDRAFAAAKTVQDVVVARARFDKRGEAFGFVGLSDYWKSIRKNA